MMWSPEQQQTTELAYKAGFDPTPKVEPFFAGMHTVSWCPHPRHARRARAAAPGEHAPGTRSPAAQACARRRGGAAGAALAGRVGGHIRRTQGACLATCAHVSGAALSASGQSPTKADGALSGAGTQSSNPAASPHTLGAGFVRGHPIFTSMILPHNIVYHPTNHPKENWYVPRLLRLLCSSLSPPLPPPLPLSPLVWV